MKYKPKTKDQRPEIQTKNKKIFWVFFCVSLLFAFCFLLSPVATAKLEKKQAAVSIPVIYPRSSWSNATYEKRTKKVWPAEYENPEIIIVHHTATNYSGITSKQIKKIYRYHSYSRKWGDIGYNYIIGSDGSIFEGRYGGNGVIGGHAYYNGTNYNKGSIGIAILGDYQKKSPSSKAMESLEKLTGWLAATNSLNLTEDVKFFKKNLSSRLIGHRDVASTACPGKNIQSQLSTVRSVADGFTKTYGDYAYRVSGESEKYEITNGKRYAGSVEETVVEISATQLKAYGLAGVASVASSEGDYAYPSGTLLEVAETGQKGVIEDGSLRPIENSTVLELSYKTANFVKITAEKWNSYPAGQDAGFRSGTLLKDENDSYYFIESGQKRLLDLPADELGKISFGKIKSVTMAGLAAYPDGAPVTSTAEFPAGTIVTNDGKKYFMVVSPGSKKEISKNVFKASFNDSMAVRASKSLTQAYKNSGSLLYQNGAMIDYRGKYHFVEDGKRRQFATKSLAKSMGYKNIVKAKRRDAGKIPDGAKISN